MPDHSDAAPNSPVARARAARKRRLKNRTLDIFLWDGDLIARVGVIDKPSVARDTLLVLAAMGEDEDLTARLSTDDMVNVMVEATVGLFVPGEEGPEPLENGQGLPLKFDEYYGEVLGVPGIDTPRAAVYSAFSEGDPPKLNSFALLMAVSEVATFLSSQESETPAKGS